MSGQGLSNNAAAVLGMVALGASSGYEIRRAAERSLRFFWALGPPQIYAELKRLEADGLVDGRDAARGARSRRAFEVTDAGGDALRAWVAGHDEPGPLELRDPELLRLFFADAAGAADPRRCVTTLRRRSEGMLEHYRSEIAPAAARTREKRGAEFPEHVADFAHDLHEFIVGWCDRLDARLEREEAR